MNIKEFLEEAVLEEEYQDYYRVVDEEGCIRDLKNGSISSSGGYISLTRDKNYHLNNATFKKENIGSLGGTPVTPYFRYTIDAEKVRAKYKVTPYKNPSNDAETDNLKGKISQRYGKGRVVSHSEILDKVGTATPKERYEAEERIKADKIPIEYIKEIKVLRKSPKLLEVIKLAKKHGIKVSQ